MANQSFGWKRIILGGNTLEIRSVWHQRHLAVIFPPFDNLHIKTFFGIWEKFAAV